MRRIQSDMEFVLSKNRNIKQLVKNLPHKVFAADETHTSVGLCPGAAVTLLLSGSCFFLAPAVCLSAAAAAIRADAVHVFAIFCAYVVADVLFL